MKTIVAAAAGVASVVAIHGTALACDAPPPPFHASTAEVALADRAGLTYVVERGGSEVSGAWRTAPSRPYSFDEGIWEYYVWTPDVPLSADTDYVLREASASSGRVFRASGTPAGDFPAESVQLDFGSVAVAVGDEYCCYGDGNSCGTASVCVSDQRNTVAQVVVGLLRPNPVFVFRAVGAEGLPGHDFFIARYAEPAGSYEVAIEAIDVRTGDATVIHSETFAADPEVDYGVSAVDLSGEPLGRNNCPSPPSVQRCETGGTPQECPAGNEAVQAAWCAQNAECRDMPDEGRCDFYADFCADDSEPEPSDDTAGCSVASGGATWLFFALGVMVVARRRSWPPSAPSPRRSPARKTNRQR